MPKRVETGYSVHYRYVPTKYQCPNITINAQTLLLNSKHHQSNESSLPTANQIFSTFLNICFPISLAKYTNGIYLAHYIAIVLNCLGDPAISEVPVQGVC